MPNGTNDGPIQLIIKGTNTEINDTGNLAVVLDFLKREEIKSILGLSKIGYVLENTGGKTTLRYPGHIIKSIK